MQRLSREMQRQGRLGLDIQVSAADCATKALSLKLQALA